MAKHFRDGLNKPDQPSRLLDELRLWSILEDEKEKKHRAVILVLKQVRDEQDVLTASIKDNECRYRIDEATFNQKFLLEVEFEQKIEALIEWGDEHCPHHSNSYGPKRKCSKCWQALKATCTSKPKDVKEKK